MRVPQSKDQTGLPQIDYFTRMHSLLRRMGQAAELRWIRSVPVLLLGQSATLSRETQPVLRISPRPQMEEALNLPACGDAFFDFQIHCPWQIPSAHRAEVAWLIGFLNLWLPLGGFQLTQTGDLLLIYELALPSEELPASVFLETIAVLQESYTQTAPLFQAVVQTRLQAEEIRCWLSQHPLKPAPLQKTLKPRPHKNARLVS